MALTLINTPLDITTADTAVATVDITSGIDGTYDSYEFHFVNMHPSIDNAEFQFQVNASNDTGGDFTSSLITSTFFNAYNREGNEGAGLAYDTYYDQAQSGGSSVFTGGFQLLARYIGLDDDQCCSGVLTLYAPSSTTYVKHFTATVSSTYKTEYYFNNYIAGYINQTLATPEIRFKMGSGNIDAGTIKMFGVS